MDQGSIRTQVSALEAQLLSVRDSIATLPEGPRMLAAADLARVRATLAELRVLLEDATIAPGPGPGDDTVLWSAERATRLYALNTSLSVTLTPEQAAQVVMGQALPALEADGGIVLASDGETLTPVSTAGDPGGLPTPAALDGGSPFAYAAQTALSIWVEDPAELSSRFPRWTAASWRSAGALAVVPLIAQAHVTGVLAFRFDRPRTFTVADRAFILVLAQQCAAAFERVELYEQVRRAAALEERNRLARDLHDSVSQALYGVVLSATVGARNLVDEPDSPHIDRTRRALENILSLVGFAQADLRALLFDMRADSVAEVGLVQALQERARFMRQRHGLAVETELCEEPPLPPACKEALYGIAREALHNAAKHARASVVSLRLKCAGEGLTLEITDDGLGFDPAAIPQGRYGMQSMRERAAELNASLEVESVPGQGTQVRVDLAWPPGAAHDAQPPSEHGDQR